MLQKNRIIKILKQNKIMNYVMSSYDIHDKTTKWKKYHINCNKMRHFIYTPVMSCSQDREKKQTNKS